MSLSLAPVAPGSARSLSAPLLAVDGLSRRFGARAVLDGVSFEVGRGEIFGLLGPNGAGKSTAFQILAGLLRPDSGVLRFAGEEVSPRSGPFRAGLGVVFQKPSLDPKLTARENLDLSAELYGVPRARRPGRIRELLALAELSARADEPVERLSGGMLRRLELARALVHSPEVLVMDEPTQGLDEPSFRRFWAAILEQKRTRRLTAVVATHRADEAELCDRLAILDGGQLVAMGTPEALKARVGGEVVVLEADDPEAIAAGLRKALGIEARRGGSRLSFEAARAHELVPRLVEALPQGSLRSVSVHRPTLADAFLALTGKGLDEEVRS